MVHDDVAVHAAILAIRDMQEGRLGVPDNATDIEVCQALQRKTDLYCDLIEDLADGLHREKSAA